MRTSRAPLHRQKPPDRSSMASWDASRRQGVNSLKTNRFFIDILRTIPAISRAPAEAHSLMLNTGTVFDQNRFSSVRLTCQQWSIVLPGLRDRLVFLKEGTGQQRKPHHPAR